MFLGSTELFYTVLPQFTFPPANSEGFNFFTATPTLVTVSLSDNSHPTGCEGVPHCVFDLHLLNE